MTTHNRIERRKAREKEALSKTLAAAGAVAVGSATVTLLVCVPILLGASYLERRFTESMDAKRLETFREQMQQIVSESAADITPQIDIDEGMRRDG